MLKLIDLTYFAEHRFSNLHELVERYRSTLGYADFIDRRLDITVIKHISKPEKMLLNGIEYLGFTSKNNFWYVPLITHRFICSAKPDVVLIQGFTFPMQVIFLRLLLGYNPKIILQYHGGKPFKMPKLMLQKLADRFVNAYLFTNKEMANEWMESSVISDKNKCYELPEGSTDFKRNDKEYCKKTLGLGGDYNFLWVGRLNLNKDPLTVLNGFEKYLSIYDSAKLYMIYQAEDLLPEVKAKINNSETLQNAVELVGKVAHNELETWYNAADFFLSASHHEGSGFALFESMACGCIPVVSHILPFRKMLSDGKFGFLFETGNADDLYKTLQKLEYINRLEFSSAVADHFQSTMSHKAIADKLVEIAFLITK